MKRIKIFERVDPSTLKRPTAPSENVREVKTLWSVVFLVSIVTAFAVMIGLLIMRQN